jgi:fructose-bisphosphate aldolase class I
MREHDLVTTAQAMVANGKGLLAMDESTPTCNKRFAALGIPQIGASRRAYRELIVTSPGLGESISGAILYDETIRQKTSKGTPFVDVLVENGILPGIKLDTGAKALAGFPGEKVTAALRSRFLRLEIVVMCVFLTVRYSPVQARSTNVP